MDLFLRLARPCFDASARPREFGLEPLAVDPGLRGRGLVVRTGEDRHGSEESDLAFFALEGSEMVTTRMTEALPIGSPGLVGATRTVSAIKASKLKLRAEDRQGIS